MQFSEITDFSKNLIKTLNKRVENLKIQQRTKIGVAELQVDSVMVEYI